MTVAVVPLMLADPAHAAAFIDLLDHYARDPMGGGDGLGAEARAHLVERLQTVPGFHGALAFDGAQALGLINCFLGFSTFAAQPLLNVHDIVVRAGRRGQGIGQALLAWAETRARELGCCKLTLEVLANNARALAAYRRAGYAPYVLDPAAATGAPGMHPTCSIRPPGRRCCCRRFSRRLFPRCIQAAESSNP